VASDRYLVTLSGRSGLYAQRAVPKNLQARLGTKLWRRKAGNTLSEARRFLPGFLAWTEEAIKSAHQGPKPLTREEDLLLARGRHIEEIIQYWPQIDENEAAGISAMPPVPLITSEQIIDKAIALKRPASGTVAEWRNCFALFNAHSELQYPLTATKEDAVNFRDHLLKTMKVSSTKKVIRYLRGHWQLCFDDSLITINIWDGIVRHLKDEEQKQTVFNHKATDASALKLKKEEQQLYYLLRYTGLRIQEALGLQAEEICHETRVIKITDNDYRGVGKGIKTPNSRRSVPIAKALEPWLVGLAETGLLFPWCLSKSKKLTTPRFLKSKLGIGPHTLRHHVATCLRDGGMNERVAGDLLGHSPSKTSTTSGYGTTTIQILREAVEKIY
jgi:site-specific recombinase XerD